MSHSYVPYGFFCVFQLLYYPLYSLIECFRQQGLELTRVVGIRSHGCDIFTRRRQHHVEESRFVAEFHRVGQ